MSSSSSGSVAQVVSGVGSTLDEKEEVDKLVRGLGEMVGIRRIDGWVCRKKRSKGNEHKLGVFLR